MRPRFALWTLAIFVLLSSFALGANLNCSIVPSGSCMETPVLYLENDTGGFQNAMVQNASVNTYAYALCCDANPAADTVTNDCSDATFLLLSSLTNAHVQQTPVGTYPISACISAVAGDIACTYSTSCTAEQECLLSMASSEGDNSTNAHVGNCSAYETKVCCAITSPPEAPILYLPANENVTLHDRTPEFVWYNATDPDGENVTYNLWVDNNSLFSDPEIVGIGINETAIWGNATNHTNNSVILDVDTPYYWRVQACDTNGMCTNSTVFNFTIESYIEITLLNATSAYGAMNVRQEDNTSDWSPWPLIVENSGNIDVDLNVTATNLFSFSPNPTWNFRYRIQANETGSYLSAYDWEWFRLNQTIYNTTVTKFNWSDSNDAISIHTFIHVPPGEPPTVHVANITISAG